MTKPQFEERQRFTQMLLLFVIVGVAVIGWWALLSTAVKILPAPHARGINWPHSVAGGVLAWIVCSVLIPVLMLFMRLVVRVTRESVTIRLAPFTRRTIPLTEIESATARTFHPMKEYGGWGVKGKRDNRAFTTSGDRGVQLVLKDGNRVLLGSQQPEKLERAINDAMAAQT